MIEGQMWSEVEWPHDRQAWCVQDAAGHCLAHVEHIVGENRDVETAIRLAKRMIVDGRMPAPEEALASLESSGSISVFAARPGERVLIFSEVRFHCARQVKADVTA